MTDMTLGQRICECRKKLNISQEALGEKVGVSRQAISKWEADGAVPEVDKLIALSKLFGVSIGWLLGVEKEAAPPPVQSEISEDLLRKIEEIVLRYRPRKQPMSAKKKALIGILAVLVLWIGGTWLKRWDIQSSTLAFTYGQVQNINEQNSNIQHQLDVLTSRLDDMTSAQEEQSKLLSDYTLELEVWTKAPGADVVFSAVPKIWNQGDSAVLSFQIPGEEAIRADCNWDGAFLTATAPLEARDGYRICLTILHADGSQEQQMLYDYRVQDLASELQIVCEVICGTGQFTRKTGELELILNDMDIHIARPGIAVEDNEKYFWKSVACTLYRITPRGRESLGTIDLMKDDADLPRSHSAWFTPSISFAIPEINDGDGLELWVKAEMNNGMFNQQMAGSWAYNNGEFIAAVPVD